MEITDYIRFVLALVLVLGLIFAFSWAMKRFGFGAAGGGLMARRRLRTIESAQLDGRHRVFLVRRDDIEHLIVVGPNTSAVIESGIVPPRDENGGLQTTPAPAAANRAFASLIGKSTAPNT
ncbi:MAG: flagellar biosynthetic protein FliO [Rhodobacteraceae bacterium]|nr:flagellar biosynthetic protein FliO [Paracoccaceae bacterium]